VKGKMLSFTTLLLLLPVLHLDAAPLGIPGTAQTINGYDTESGGLAICWNSEAAASADEGLKFGNRLVRNFTTSDKGIHLLESCPEGTTLMAEAPLEFKQGERLRTLGFYNYTVKVTIDLDHFQGTDIASDSGTSVAVQLIACDTLTAGFCSPFVHDQAILRLAALNETKKPWVKGNRHGGTHVHSGYTIVNLDETLRQHEFTVTVPLIINQPGSFYVIGILQMFTGPNSTTPIYRYDISNALQGKERLIIYQDPAKILEVSKAILILSYVAVGLVSCIILFLLQQTIRHYKTQVLQLSQAPFLVVFQLAALVATLGTVLLEPRSDVFCQVSKPILLISLQLLYAIPLGRLWRIHAVISPLLRRHLTKQTRSALEILFHRITCGCFDRNSVTNLRQEVSPWKVVRIVGFVMMPQVVLQIVALILQPQERTIEFNSDESIGRAICQGQGVDSSKEDILNYSFYALLLVVVMLLCMAHFSRRLPSLFNESQVIYSSTLMSVLLLVLGLGVLTVTDTPTTSPDVEYMIWVVLVLSMTSTMTIQCMMPKLRMVWSGEVVLVSKLVSDQRQSVCHSEASSRSLGMRSSVMHNVTGLNSTASDGHYHYDNATSIVSRASEAVTSNVSRVSASQISEPEDPRVKDTKHELDDRLTESTEKNKDATSDSDESPGSSTEPAAETKKLPIDRHVSFDPKDPPTQPKDLQLPKVKRTTKIVIKQGEAPSRRLILKMVDLHDHLEQVTTRIMSGLQVPEEDWEQVRRMTGTLEDTFQDHVEFAWEERHTLLEKKDNTNGGDDKKDNQQEGPSDNV
jgi:hypothetical protein